MAPPAWTPSVLRGCASLFQKRSLIVCVGVYFFRYTSLKASEPLSYRGLDAGLTSLFLLNFPLPQPCNPSPVLIWGLVGKTTHPVQRTFKLQSINLPFGYVQCKYTYKINNTKSFDFYFFFFYFHF